MGIRLDSFDGAIVSTASTGNVDINVTWLNFSSEDDYEVITLCGNGYVVCNNPTNSPPSAVKTSTQFRVTVTTAPWRGLVVARKAQMRDPVT